jgi:hypothetical protein
VLPGHALPHHRSGLLQKAKCLLQLLVAWMHLKPAAMLVEVLLLQN